MAMSKQAYYDLLVRSSIDGTLPSFSKLGGCLYRGEGKKRCAIGLLISDEVYCPKFEGATVDALLEKLLPFFPADINLPDATRIQRCHDVLCSNLGDCSISWSSKNWNSFVFLRSLNDLPCFSNVAQTDDAKLQEMISELYDIQPKKGEDHEDSSKDLGPDGKVFVEGDVGALCGVAG